MPRKLRPIADLFWSHVEKTPTCWLWTGHRLRQGYGTFHIRRKQVLAHRASWELHNDPIPLGLDCCHRCDVPACVRPDHLFLGTVRENMADMDAKGRRVPPLGSRHAKAKLIEADIPFIRHWAKIYPKTEVAAAFGVVPSAIRAIVSGKNWSHVHG